MPSVYVAAPSADAARVRLLHERMRALGLKATSRWAETAHGPEDFANYGPEVLREFAEQNDRDLFGSDFCLVMARDGAVGEMFAEARLALERKIHVVWLGRRTLSAWRDGVTRVEDIDEALRLMVGG